MKQDCSRYHRYTLSGDDGTYLTRKCSDCGRVEFSSPSLETRRDTPKSLWASMDVTWVEGLPPKIELPVAYSYPWYTLPLCV